MLTTLDAVVRTVRRLVRRSDSPVWRVHELVSPNGLIYIVRDAPGREREIQHPMRGTWTPESRTRFSFIPLYERYHAQQYRAAKPYTSNVNFQRRGFPAYAGKFCSVIPLCSSTPRF